MAFGFKYGLPADLDLLFDVRFLRNPNYVAELAPLTGNDAPVAAFILMIRLSNRSSRRLPIYWPSCFHATLPKARRNSPSVSDAPAGAIARSMRRGAYSSASATIRGSIGV